MENLNEKPDSQFLKLNTEWEIFLNQVNHEKWTIGEETSYYLAFCTGWWARTGEASFQMKKHHNDGI